MQLCIVGVWFSFSTCFKLNQMTTLKTDSKASKSTNRQNVLQQRPLQVISIRVYSISVYSRNNTVLATLCLCCWVVNIFETPRILCKKKTINKQKQESNQLLFLTWLQELTDLTDISVICVCTLQLAHYNSATTHLACLKMVAVNFEINHSLINLLGVAERSGQDRVLPSLDLCILLAAPSSQPYSEENCLRPKWPQPLRTSQVEMSHSCCENLMWAHCSRLFDFLPSFH